MAFGMVDVKCAFCGSEDFVCYSKAGNPVEVHKVRAKAYWAVIDQQAAEAAAAVEEAAEKVAVAKIKVQHSEAGPFEGVSVAPGGESSVWEKFDALLDAMLRAYRAKGGGNYAKVAFRIEWEDGEYYIGRFDIGDGQPLDLSLHIAHHAQYFVGSYFWDRKNAAEREEYINFFKGRDMGSAVDEKVIEILEASL